MLARLTLTDFRNHHALDLAPGDGFVVLIGDNGTGKTNVLEAVSLLAPGRGLRRARLSEMARQDGPGGFAVAAVLADDGTRIGTGAEAAAPERRVVRVNGAAAPATQLPERLTVLWLTPAMDRVFAGAAADRRGFLDRLTLALAPGHALHAQRYEAAMRDRNRLLAAEALPDPDWLAALEGQMAEHGAAIDAARQRTVALLEARLARGPAGDFPRAAIALAGEELVGGLAEALRRSRARDALAGRALVGPHRVDLAVRHVAKDQPAQRCSTGEQKALLLGIVLAHAELVAEQRGRAPVLLLDEVAAHLDPARRGALFARLQGLGQVWMTGTEASLFAEIGAEATIVSLPPA